jgi:hypothetical protein
VVPDDVALGQAPGPRRFDVVALERLEHVDAHEADEDAADHEAERHRREHEVAEHVPERVEVERYERVDQEQVRRRLEVEAHLRGSAARAREPAEPLAEDDLGEEAEEEDGRRVDHDPEQPPGDVDRGVSVASAYQPDRDADRQGHEKRRDRELERRRPVLADHLGDGAVVDDRLAEVERDDVAQVLEVLNDQRPVVAGRLAPLL